SESHPFSHLLFALSLGLCVYNFFRSITLDPGTAPKPSSDAELKSIIEDLASEGRLNGQTFCVTCMAKRPLRSKHCRIFTVRGYGIAVSRTEIDNREFPCLLIAGFSGNEQPSTIQVSASSNPSSDVSPSCLFPTSMCYTISYDTFLFVVVLWSTLQLSWTIILLASQLWQVSRQMTTLEVSNLGRYGFMGGRGTSMSAQMGASQQVGGVSGIDTPGAEGELGHKHRNHKGCCGSGFLMHLLGLDRFTKGKATEGLARSTRAHNPFDLGFFGNCKDFWTTGKELGVEYERVYDVPKEGFVEAKKRKEIEDDSSLGSGYGSGGSGVGSLRKKLTMSLSLGSFGRGRSGYEPVSQV
ncbi:hypothetical protein BJ322DRAFT_1006914, partial [Thelephora terrestris]